MTDTAEVTVRAHRIHKAEEKAKDEFDNYFAGRGYSIVETHAVPLAWEYNNVVEWEVTVKASLLQHRS